MRISDGHNYMTVISYSLPPIMHSAMAHQWQTFTFRMDYYATWDISVFLQASVRSLFGKRITVGWHGTLAWKRQSQCYKSIFIGRSSTKMLADISYIALPTPSPSLPLRSKGCTHLFPLPMNLGSPSQWTKCQEFLQPSMVMIVYLWSWITSLRWP